MSKQPLIDQLDLAIGHMLANPAAGALPATAEVMDLLRLARELRDLPRADFKASLRADLERKVITMSTKTVVSPPGFHTVNPYLLPQSLEYLDFLKDVFGAEEVFRGEVGPGRVHAEVRIGDSIVMIGVGSGRQMPTGLGVYVPNVDEVYKRAIDAGCVELQPIEDAHWEPVRFGCVQDPAGNTWSIATHLGKSHIPEGRHTIAPSFFVKEAARFMDFLKKAYDAVEVQRFEWPGGFYAAARIGDSVVGVSESTNHEWMRPTLFNAVMRVPECDAVYEQALRAGAKSLTPVVDQPYGVRGGAVEDAWGNTWFIATPL